MDLLKLKCRKECPLCKSTNSSLHIPFPDIPVNRCLNCSFMYSGKILSESELATYYEKGFGSKRHLQGQIVNARINFWAITKFLNIQGIKNILDIGTGYGFLLNEFQKRLSIKTAGVELSKQEAEYAQVNLKLKVINTPLTESGFKKNNYDLVTAFEVIEHISSPIDFIQEMAEYVKPNGFLLLMTDNFESRMAKKLGAGFPKWIPHTHISHFSPTTLKTAIKAVKELTFIKSMSYTPWEVLLRAAYYDFRGINKSPSESFNLDFTLKNEMHGDFKLFYLRKFINKKWAQFTLTDKMDGDLMYFLARKKS